MRVELQKTVGYKGYNGLPVDGLSIHIPVIVLIFSYAM